MAFAYYDHLPMGHGYCAEVAMATGDGFRFSRKVFKEVLALFFHNRYYNNNIRLQALISPDNQQALRLVRLAGFTKEGQLRDVASDGDRVLLSLLKEEYEQIYGRYILKTKNTSGT